MFGNVRSLLLNNLSHIPHNPSIHRGLSNRKVNYYQIFLEFQTFLIEFIPKSDEMIKLSFKNKICNEFVFVSASATLIITILSIFECVETKFEYLIF